jgi:hypothetical protein
MWQRSYRIRPIKGNHLIIAGDINENVELSQTEELFLALGMREVIKIPTSYVYTNMKREPIDGIWASKDLHINGVGYALFGYGCGSDHHLLWADFSYHTTFGKEYLKTYQTPTKRLRAGDPRHSSGHTFCPAPIHKFAMFC